MRPCGPVSGSWMHSELVSCSRDRSGPSNRDRLGGSAAVRLRRTVDSMAGASARCDPESVPVCLRHMPDCVRHVIYRVGVRRHWPTKVRLRSGRPGRCFRSCRVSRQVCFDTRGTGGGWPILRLVIGSFRGDRHHAIAPARMELSAIGPPRRPTLYFIPGHWGPVYRARHARCTHRLPRSYRSACTARRSPADTRAVSPPGTGTAPTPDALRSVSAIHPVPSTVGAAQSCSGDQPSCARPADLHAPCPSI